LDPKVLRGWSLLCLAWLLAIAAQSGVSAQDQKAAAPDAHVVTGSLVIPPQFDSAGPFSEGLAAVETGGKESGKWGYIDKSGNLAIAPQFDRAEAFSEGLAAVRRGDDKTGKWGFIDKSGKYAIAPKWEHVTAFSRGLAVVRIGNIVTGKERIIGKEGKYISDLQSDTLVPCENGMILVGTNLRWEEKDWIRHFGFVDKSNKYAINAKFDDAFCFTEGLAAVRVGDARTGKWGFIDETGKFVIDPQWDSALVFRDGIATVGIVEGMGKKWGAIDKTGSIAIPLQFPGSLGFHDGLALVWDTSYQWVRDQRGKERVLAETRCGFIDKGGRIAIALQWRSASHFSQKLAPVMLGEYPTGKWGYIDQSGRYVVTPQYDDAEPFSEGLAAVLVNDNDTEKWGYIAR